MLEDPTLAGLGGCRVEHEGLDRDVRAGIDVADEADDLAARRHFNGAAERRLGAVLEPQADLTQAIVLALLRELALERRQGALEKADNGIRAAVMAVRM